MLKMLYLLVGPGLFMGLSVWVAGFRAIGMVVLHWSGCCVLWLVRRVGFLFVARIVVGVGLLC